MRLDLMTWPEVEAHIAAGGAVILPVGSTEQHGPMGLIGTDAICATAIAERAAEAAGAVVAPTLAYTPAPFNTLFPGTLSVSEPVFRALFGAVLDALAAQGFARIYVLNAHGANLAPMRDVIGDRADVRLRSWWDFAPVNRLRRDWYGDWEGMHATPSEVAVTQALHRVVAPGSASRPPRMLDADERAARAGDNHGSAERHRSEFPDGRVGSHSALATPAQGAELLATAGRCVAEDLRAFVADAGASG